MKRIFRIYITNEEFIYRKIKSYYKYIKYFGNPTVKWVTKLEEAIHERGNLNRYTKIITKETTITIKTEIKRAL